MGPTRYPEGSAHGFVNQFNYRGTTAGNITGSATPNVTLGDLFYANNTDVLTITNFILDDTANRAVNYEGKLIRVFFLDTATRIANAAPLFLNGTDNLAVGQGGGNSYLELMYSRATWYETNRSTPNRSDVQSYSVGPASSINVDMTKVALVLNTGSVTKFISAFSGGQIGQHLTLVNAGSNVIVVQTGGNILLVGTNAFLVNASGAYEFVRASGSLWRMITIGTLGNA